MTDNAPKLADALIQLQTAISSTHNFFDNKLDKTDIPKVLLAFKQLDEHYDTLEALYKILGKLKEELSRETIPNLFQANGITSMRAHGRNFILGSRMSASLIDKGSGYKWLRDNGADYLIVETVNSQSLSSWVREYIKDQSEKAENNETDEVIPIRPPEEIIKINTMTYTQIRK